MPADAPATGLHFHVLCQVVDNFGDAGVGWRLARSLARDAAHAVDLWIDDPGLLADLRDTAPLLAPAPQDEAAAARVQVHRLQGDDTPLPPVRDHTRPVVLLSAFGTPLPTGWRALLAGAPARHLWVNVEYLSAEDWVEGCHGLSSRKPADGVTEHFFYPGFSPRTGGLLREPELATEPARFVTAPERSAWEARLGLPRPAAAARRIALFCYPQAPLAPWLARLERGPEPVELLACARTADAALTRWAGRPLAPGDAVARGALRVTRLPWLHPADFDRLLWTCDLNFVRGEDSWVRAQWAARPFVWQAYPQAEAAHHRKLEAFLARVPAGEGPPAAAWRHWNRLWNGADTTQPLEAAWDELLAALPPLESVWPRWRDTLAAGPDLTRELVRFCRDRL